MVWPVLGVVHQDNPGSTGAVEHQVDHMCSIPKLASGIRCHLILLCHLLRHIFVGTDAMLAVEAGCLHDGLEVLLHQADLVSHALPSSRSCMRQPPAAVNSQYRRSTSRAGWVLTTWATAAQWPSMRQTSSFLRHLKTADGKYFSQQTITNRFPWHSHKLLCSYSLPPGSHLSLQWRHLYD